MIDFNGVLTYILTYLSFDKNKFKEGGNGKGTNGGKATAETRTADVIDAVSNTADAAKEINEMKAKNDKSNKTENDTTTTFVHKEGVYQRTEKSVKGKVVKIEINAKDAR